MPFILLFCLILSLHAKESTTRELDAYIAMLNLRPLTQNIQRREAMYKLGAHLFHEKRLSGKNNISCAHCHSLASFSGDSLPLAVGEGAIGLGEKRQQIEGKLIPRHSPPLYNLGLPGVKALFWDGRVQYHSKGGWLTPEPKLNGPNPEFKDLARRLDSLLAVQSIFPLTSPEEMLGKDSKLTKIEAWNLLVRKIKEIPKYQNMLKEAFPEESSYSIAHIGNALAEFERHAFLATGTPWDEYLRGKRNLLTERMKRGANLFMGKAQCVNCHTGEHFSSFGFQNIAIPQIGPGVSEGDDKGLFEFTKNPLHLYRFRVSPLRNLALTAPYMHSGAFSTIWEVIEHYAHPTGQAPHWNSHHPRYHEPLILDEDPLRHTQRVEALATNLPREIQFSPEEKNDLCCFLMVALTDIKLHKHLKGVLDEISDCSPLASQHL